jgi:glycosyltransferase involved in cell wall biosynthesis
VAPAPLVVHTEASRGFGGQELRILGETRWLLGHGWRALIVAQPRSRLLHEAHAASLPAVAVPMRHALDLRAVLSLRRVLAAHDARLVHTHSSVDSWVGGLAARSRGLAVVRGRHVSIRVPRRRALVYRLPHRIITSGDGVKAVLTAAGLDPARITTVAAGVDLARFHAGVSGAGVRAELALDGPVAGLVANIRGSKGHDVFLDAAREVLAAEPRARFLIVGDGVGFEDVKAKVRAQGLERSVVMTGFRRDVPDVMAALDVLVLPSIRSEAISQVLPQAMALGTPVIASRMGGSPEIVHDGETGRLVPPGDARALAAAILATFGDRDGARAMAERARALVQQRFSFDAQMEVTAGVYRELLDSRR